MKVKCPRCGIKEELVNNKCTICDFIVEEQQSREEKDLATKSSLEDSQKAALSKPFYKNIYIIAVLILMISFVVYKSSVRDTSSPSKAYVGHWKYRGEYRGRLLEHDSYVKSDGTETTINKDGTKVLGVWTVAAENADKREMHILKPLHN